MKILKIKPENLRESKQAIGEAINTIKKGGTIIFPTDTVYGLGCDATNEKAVEKIFRIKKRPESKPVPVLVSDIGMAKQISFFDNKVEKILLSVWPGAITVLLQKKFNSLPEMVSAGKSTIGLRIPDYKIAHFLTAKCGVPLVATSANITGKPASNEIGKVLAQFGKAACRPDLVLDAGDLKFAEPSTILDLSKGKLIITRVGNVNKKKLFEIIGV